MSKFSIGFAPPSSIRTGTPQARVNANVRRPFPYARGYLAVVGFLGLVAALSTIAAVWRVAHFVR